MWSWTAFRTKESGLSLCARACVCVCVYAHKWEALSDTCATSLGGALGRLFRGLTIVCRRQFFFVWKFTNHQWKCHRESKSSGAKSLASSSALRWGWWWWCICPPCPLPSDYFSPSQHVTDFRATVNISFHPEIFFAARPFWKARHWSWVVTVKKFTFTKPFLFNMNSDQFIQWW